MLGRNGQIIVARVITPPEPFITIEEARGVLRLEDDVHDEDQFLVGLISAATAFFEGPAGRLGRAVAPQLLEVSLDLWPDTWERLPCPPFLQIQSVRYVDLRGDWHELSGETLATNRPRVVRAKGGSVVVRYWAGYGSKEDGTDEWRASPPAPLKQAALSLLAHWFSTREAVNIGNITTEVPLGGQSIVNLYKIPRV